MITSVQEVLFDLSDLLESNPHLMTVKIEGFNEFDTLGEFLLEQKSKMQYIEECIEE